MTRQEYTDLVRQNGYARGIMDAATFLHNRGKIASEDVAEVLTLITKKEDDNSNAMHTGLQEQNND